MPRLSFLLILTKNPAAVDVVRQDALVEPATLAEVSVNGEVRFQWEKSKGQFEEIEGVVLKIGMKKDLIVVNIDTNGNELGAGAKGIGTRKQEIEKERLQQAYAKEHHLQVVAMQMLENGPDSVCENQNAPVIKLRRPSKPRVRSQAYLQNLEIMLANMPCRKKGTNKVELWKNKNVWIDSGRLSTLQLMHGMKPKSLFQAILRLAIPKSILLTDGISATGSRGCVSIPKDIIDTIILHVGGVYKRNGGKAESVKYNPFAILTNRICNVRRKAGVFVGTMGDAAPSSAGPSSSSLTFPAHSTFSNSPPSSPTGSPRPGSSAHITARSSPNHISPPRSPRHVSPPRSPRHISPPKSPTAGGSEQTGDNMSFQMYMMHVGNVSTPPHSGRSDHSYAGMTPITPVQQSDDRDKLVTDSELNVVDISYNTVREEIVGFQRY